MKKFTSIAAALCLATAFCGMCTGCANGIKEDVNNQNDGSVAVTADTDYKLILCPGYANGYGSTANTIASGATKLSADEEKTYFVHNAYFATGTAGSELPTPAGRTDATFNGWRRAEDGVLVTYKVVPNLSETMYLYAEWVANGSGSQGGGQGSGGEVSSKTDGVYVGDTKLGSLTRNTENTTREEYWLGGAKMSSLTVGTNLEIYMNGQKISAFIEPESSGVVKNGDSAVNQFPVGLAGDYVVYLHKNPNDWSVQFVVSTPVPETTVTIPSNAAYTDISFGGGSSVRLYIKSGGTFETSLSGYNLYMWNGDTKYFGEWPGKAMAASMPTTQSLTDGVNFIINKSGTQTRDLGGLQSGGTYVVTFASGNDSKVEKVKTA